MLHFQLITQFIFVHYVTLLQCQHSQFVAQCNTTMHMLQLIPASRSSLRREADACVSTRLTGASQAPIVAHGVSRSFRAHHIDAALGLESDGMFRSCARY